MTDDRKCRGCDAVKSRAEFYKTTKGGLSGKCKECIRGQVRAYRAENLDRIRLYDRARANLPHRVQKTLVVVREWRAAHPERARAHMAVGRAVAAGVLTPQPCWVCGSKAVAHHPDYAAPLDVVWLCQQHHKQAHALTAVC